MRAFFFLTAFVVAALQLIVCVWKKGKWTWTVLPVAVSFLSTAGMQYVVQYELFGPGMFPFPAGYGLYLFSIMATVGTVLGLVSWLWGYVLFRKASLSQIKTRVTLAIFIVLQFVLVITVYLLTA